MRYFAPSIHLVLYTSQWSHNWYTVSGTTACWLSARPEEVALMMWLLQCCFFSPLLPCQHFSESAVCTNSSWQRRLLFVILLELKVALKFVPQFDCTLRTLYTVCQSILFEIPKASQSFQIVGPVLRVYSICQGIGCNYFENDCNLGSSQLKLCSSLVGLVHPFTCYRPKGSHFTVDLWRVLLLPTVLSLFVFLLQQVTEKL